MQSTQGSQWTEQIVFLLKVRSSSDKYELKGGSFKEYKDKGYSGKNTVRPQLQQLLTDIRRGEVEKVIVYKLDRISRSILDFSNMMNLFQQYQVEFVSSTEKFDTSTPMGRAMLKYLQLCLRSWNVRLFRSVSATHIIPEVRKVFAWAASSLWLSA